MISLRRRNAIDSLAIATIGVYQRHLSPRKGFACAYRVLHNRDSCSQYVKGAIARYGLIEALHLSRQRFADCKAAYQILQAERKKDKDSHRSTPNNPCSQAIDTGCDILSCTESCSNLGDCTPLDSSSDCGGCDVGGCDSCSCDFGSCS